MSTKTKAIVSVSLALMLASGCLDVKFADSAKGAAAGAVAGAAPFADAADAATTAYEDATGSTLFQQETAEKLESLATNIQQVSSTLQKVAAAAESISPDDKKPIAQTVNYSLAGLAAVAASVANYMRKRKNAALKTAVLTAEALPGGGKTVASVAASCGTSVDIQKTYEASLSAGVVGSSASASGNAEASSTT